jgi:UDP-glucose:(heptosyl)LPS alpha-1,3-glucosyltransferase
MGKSLRIAIVKSSLQGASGIKGGLEKYTLKLADAFASCGHEIFILTTDWLEQEVSKYRVINFGKRSKLSFWHLLNFDNACKKWFRENAVDAVFGFDRNFCVQNYYRAGNGVHAAYLDHRKSFSSFFKNLTFQINPLHRLILAMERKTFENKKLKKLFTNSEMVRREVLKYYPQVDPNKVIAIHNGVEWHEFQKPFEASFLNRDEIFTKLKLNPKAYQFLFIGNEYQRKGLGRLLQALSELKEHNFQLSIVGKERNSTSFMELSKKFGLENKVFFFGPQKEVMPFYQVADCLAIPSFYDPFANVTVEALAMGLYVVSSKKNGGSEVIKTAQMGSVFSAQEDLTSSLACAISHKKTQESATIIRNLSMHLDFSNQIKKIVSELEKDFVS